MKKFILLLVYGVVCGVVYASQERQEVLQKRVLISTLALSSDAFSKDFKEHQSGSESFPSLAIRQRKRDVASWSQEILKCKTESDFNCLCLKIADFCATYRDYMDKTDFTQVEGLTGEVDDFARTGKELLQDSLISVLRQVAEKKNWSLLLIPDLENIKPLDIRTKSWDSSSVGHDNQMSYDGKVKRLPRSDSWSSNRLQSRHACQKSQELELLVPSKNELRLSFPYSNELSNEKIKWTDVESEGSDS